jgi:arylsulfatase A-like enzyme
LWVGFPARRTLVVPILECVTRAPNVLYLHTHDSGRHVGPYGQRIPTPRMDQVAREGMVFHQAYSAAPTCSPSRAALLTGQLPHNAGMYGLAHRGWQLHDPSQHLATTLREAGYRTAMVGVQHVSTQTTDVVAGLGYTDFLGDGCLAPETAQAGADFVRRHCEANPEQPFFLSVGFIETHTMSINEFLFGYPPDPDLPVAPAPTMPSTPDTRGEMGSYAAAALVADTAMGKVIDAVEAVGQTADTLLIITTDHGVAMPEMKCTLTDRGHGVMLILRGPGGFVGGVESDSLVSQLDLYPTICELAGIPKPAWLQGTSMLPLAADPSARIRDRVFAEVTYHASYEPKRTIRTDRYRYTRRYDERRTPVLPNIDNSLSKKLWVDNGYADHLLAGEELFDTLFDPNETVNLVEDCDYAGVVAQLSRELGENMRQTADPLLDGPVTLPAGIKDTPPDGYDPRLPAEVAAAGVDDVTIPHPGRAPSLPV